MRGYRTVSVGDLRGFSAWNRVLPGFEPRPDLSRRRGGVAPAVHSSPGSAAGPPASVTTVSRSRHRFRAGSILGALASCRHLARGKRRTCLDASVVHSSPGSAGGPTPWTATGRNYAQFRSCTLEEDDPFRLVLF